MSEGRWIFKIEQDSQVVASGSAPTKFTAMREAAHYTMMYGHDGPVKTTVFKEKEK